MTIMLGHRDLKKVLLTWAGPWVDKGEAGMVVATVEALRAVIPNISVVVATVRAPREEDTRGYGEYGIRLVAEMFQQATSLRESRLLARFAPVRAGDLSWIRHP